MVSTVWKLLPDLDNAVTAMSAATSSAAQDEHVKKICELTRELLWDVSWQGVDSIGYSAALEVYALFQRALERMPGSVYRENVQQRTDELLGLIKDWRTESR